MQMIATVTRARALGTAAARRRSRGLSLLELAMYLGIAGVIAAGVMTYYSNSSNNQKVQDTLSMLGSVQTVVRNATSGQPDYTGITETVVAATNQLPRKFVRFNTAATPAPTGLTNPFGGATTIVAQSDGTNNSRFNVTMTQIPRDGCTRLAVQDLGTGLAQVAVAASGTPTIATAPPAVPFRTTAEANAECTARLNTITWSFF